MLITHSGQFLAATFCHSKRYYNSRVQYFNPIIVTLQRGRHNNILFYFSFFSLYLQSADQWLHQKPPWTWTCRRTPGVWDLIWPNTSLQFQGCPSIFVLWNCEITETHRLGCTDPVPLFWGPEVEGMGMKVWLCNLQVPNFSSVGQTEWPPLPDILTLTHACNQTDTYRLLHACA